MLGICEQIAERNLKIHFRVLFRTESVARMDDKVLRELKRRGLFHVFLGVESGYEPALRIFHKRASIQDNVEAIKKIRKHNINLTTGFIMFHPYTTREEILENEKFIIENQLCFSTYSFVSKMAVHKGAYIYKKAKRDGLLTADYSICNPYGYVFKNSEIVEIYEMLQECFLVLKQNKSKELVNLLTYLEDDIRKKESEEVFADISEDYFDFFAEIRKDIGKKQLELFQYIVHNSKYDQMKIQPLVNQLCETIETRLRELNKFHKEWMRLKMQNRIR